MKNLILLALGIVLITSCKKNKAIEYPAESTFGTNILAMDTIEVKADITYGMRAHIPKNGGLKIHLYKTMGGVVGLWYLNAFGGNGWSAGDFTGGQWFTSTEEGWIDQEITFSGSYTAIMDYFENGADPNSEPTFSKTISVTE